MEKHTTGGSGQVLDDSAKKSIAPLKYSVALISAASLAYEVLLMRLFAIIQWHHFAYMIISLALLGYGASGTFLSLMRRHLLRRFEKIYPVNLILFGLSSLGCFFLAQKVSFNPEELLWDTEQLFRLSAIYLLLAIPFFFAANGIGLALSRYTARPGQVYAADLVGAGIGSLAIVLLLFVVFPHTGLRIVAVLGFFAAILALWELHCERSLLYFLLVSLAISCFFLPSQWITPKPLPYKALSKTLQIGGTRIIGEYSSPLGLLTVVESPVIPFRHAPGISLRNSIEPPRQIGVFIDADNMTAITEFNGRIDRLAYLDQLTSALPYHLHELKQVLILGAGTGVDVLQARAHGITHVEAVELNPQMIDLLKGDFSKFSGEIYNSQDTVIHVGEARGHMKRGEKRFDLIQISLLDSFNAAAGGLYALNENYVYTVEAIQEYFEDLLPGGYLAITRWIRSPPQDTLKLFATAYESLEQTAQANPGKRLLLVRGWQTSTLIVKKGLFDATEIEAAKKFCRSRNFDIAYYSGITADQTNDFNVLKEPYFYMATQAIVADEPTRQAFFDNYKFDIRPATDDRPFFFNFFKWKTFTELFALRGHGGVALLESGYLVLLATLAQSMTISAGLVLVPFFIYRYGRDEQVIPRDLTWTIAYFFCIGIAFMFIEIFMIQKFILFLHHPLYSTAVVLFAFLMFAGLGSFNTSRMVLNDRSKGVIVSIFGITVISAIYLLVLDKLFDLFAGWIDPLKVVLTILLISPLGFLMGMPFPLGLAKLRQVTPGLTPLAWGVNGCASVNGVVLATLVALNYGFMVLVMIALCCYGLAGVSIRRCGHHG